MSLPDFQIPADNPAHGVHAVPPSLSPIDAVIDAAVAALGRQLPPMVIVARFPDRPADFDFEGYEAAVLMIYDGSKFDTSGQREELRLTAIILVRSLDGENGGYRLIQLVRDALHDRSLAGATGTRPTEVELEAEADGVFRWRVVFAAALPAVAVRPSRLGIPRRFQTERP